MHHFPALTIQDFQAKQSQKASDGGKKIRQNDKGRMEGQSIFFKKRNIHQTTKDFLEVKNIKAEI